MTGVPEYFKSNCVDRCIFMNPDLHKEYKDLVPYFGYCNTICAHIVIDERNSFQFGSLTFHFRRVKKIYGSLKVSGTNFTSASFLAGIEEIECENEDSFVFENNNEMLEIGMLNLTRVSCQISISRNSLMSKLNLPNLKYFSSSNSSILQYIDMQIFDMPSTFCISHQEMGNFIKDPSLYMSTLPLKYCPIDSNFEEKTCEFEENSTVETLDSECVRILGNVTLRGGEEGLLYKLQSMKYLFGNLEFHFTNLTSIVLPELEYVASLDRK